MFRNLICHDKDYKFLRPLFAMIPQLGSASLFCSFSYAETDNSRQKGNLCLYVARACSSMFCMTISAMTTTNNNNEFYLREIIETTTM